MANPVGQKDSKKAEVDHVEYGEHSKGAAKWAPFVADIAVGKLAETVGGPIAELMTAALLHKTEVVEESVKDLTTDRVTYYKDGSKDVDTRSTLPVLSFAHHDEEGKVKFQSTQHPGGGRAEETTYDTDGNVKSKKTVVISSPYGDDPGLTVTYRTDGEGNTTTESDSCVIQ